MALPVPVAARVRLEQGRFADDGRTVTLRGVAYSNYPTGFLPGGPHAPFCLSARDLPLIAAAGANTVRTFALPPEEDKAFLPVLESTGLYWLAGFPLDAYHDPGKSIVEQRERILADFRRQAERFRGQPRLIAYVFGDDVARDYSRKFAGTPSEFYALLEDAAAILHETEPGSPPLLTTAVSDIEEMRRDAPGLSFWSWNAAGMSSFGGRLEAVRRTASKPVLVASFGIDAYDQRAGREEEGLQADAAAALLHEIEVAGFTLGAVYASFVDEWWRGGPDPSRHLTGGSPDAGSPDGFRNEAWFGIFRAIVTGGSGMDSLAPRAVFGALAGAWGGTPPAAWRMESLPRVDRLENLASGMDAIAPGALVRALGSALTGDADIPGRQPWALHWGTTCLCLGGEAVPLFTLSSSSVTGQLPWTLEPGELSLVLYRAGKAANVFPARVQEYAPGIFPEGVLRAGSACTATAANGVRPGEVLEVYATGLGRGQPPWTGLEARVNGVPAKILYLGLLPAFVGLNQVNLQVDPETPASATSDLELRMGGYGSNFYRLPVASAAERPAVVLSAAVSDVVVQAGGAPASIDVKVGGANGFCGPVLFTALDPPAGISFRVPVGFTGGLVPLQIRAAAGARPMQDGRYVLAGHSGGAASGELVLRLTVLPSSGDVPVRVISGGYRSKPQARFDWNGRTLYNTSGGGAGRGINVLAVDPRTGLLSGIRAFDTWQDAQAAVELVRHIDSLPEGTLVMLAVADEGTLHLGSEARATIAASFGSRYIQSLGYQHSWALIGRKGAAAPLAEGASADQQVILERVLRLPME